MMSSLYKKKAPKISHQDTHVYRNLFRPEIHTHGRSRHDHDFEKDLNVYKSSLNQQAKGQGVFLHITGFWSAGGACAGRRAHRRSSEFECARAAWRREQQNAEPQISL